MCYLSSPAKMMHAPVSSECLFIMLYEEEGKAERIKTKIGDIDVSREEG